MKRICFGVLAALMVLSLVGCGDMTGLPDTLPTLEPFNFEEATPTPIPAESTPEPVATAVPTVTPEPVPAETPAPVVNDDASAEPASDEAASGEAASDEAASEEAPSEEAATEEPISEEDAEPEDETETDAEDMNPGAEAVEQEIAEPMEEDAEEEEYPLVPGTYEGEDAGVLTVEEDGSCTYETLVSGTIEETPVSAGLTFKGTLENGKVTFDSVWYNDIDLTQLALDAGFEDASRWEMAAELLYIGE